MTRVLVAALTSAMRVGIRALLDGSDLQVLGETPALADWPDALAEVDVVVAGDARALLLPAGAAHADRPRAAVVFGDEPAMVDALRELALSAWGVVSRDASAAELQAAVAAAAQGLVVLPPALLARLPALRPRGSTPPGLEPAEEPLTPRELEVLDLLSQGLANRAIAERLGISENTVKFHVASVTGKLGASGRTDAVARGLRRGLIRL